MDSIGIHGALVKVCLSNPCPRPFVLGGGVRALPGTVEVDALVSTASAITSILPDLIRFPLGLTRVRTAAAPGGGAGEVAVYAVDLEVGGVRFAGLEVSDGWGGREFAQARFLPGRGAVGEPPVFHVLLGRDVLRRARVIYDGARGVFEVVFR